MQLCVSSIFFFLTPANRHSVYGLVFQPFGVSAMKLCFGKRQFKLKVTLFFIDIIEFCSKLVLTN